MLQHVLQCMFRAEGDSSNPKCLAIYVALRVAVCAAVCVAVCVAACVAVCVSR